MKAFTIHTGIPVPLRRAEVDTDQIIPSDFLKRVTRSGYEDGLFFSWRFDPEFVLNQAPYDQGSILVVAPHFGIGSSREHAVWALLDFGFRCVIGADFGPIFASNAGNAGLLLATVSTDDVEQIWDVIEAEPGRPMTVDLNTRTIELGETTWAFAISEHTRGRLLAGLDDIGLTLRHEADIAAFEARRPEYRPRTM